MPMKCRSSTRSIRRGILTVMSATALFVALPGCSGPDMPMLDDYLEELEFNTPLESLKEVPLGTFRISSVPRHEDPSKHKSKPAWMQINFKLYVIATPENESAILAAYERHRGMFDDTVIKIFRNASLDELSDPRWATIKSRLSDSTRPILGSERVRQIVVDDYTWEPI